MHEETLFSRTATIDATHDRLLTGLVVVLADVLRTTPDRIDPAETFRLLGLDSDAVRPVRRGAQQPATAPTSGPMSCSTTPRRPPSPVTWRAR